MAEHNKTIPLEIWMRVFECLKDPSDLCQCRLVCKNWDYIAETALFASNLCVVGIWNVSRMYNHLVEKPKRAHLIRHLQLVWVNGDEPEKLLLLKKAFTTTMESLLGEDEFSTMRPEFFALLLDIKESAPPQSQFNLHRFVASEWKYQNYAKAAYAFRNTLESLWTQIDSPYMQSMFDQLKVFTQLRQLTLNKYNPLESLKDLDAILKHCSKLEKLNLWFRKADLPHQTTAAIEEWLKADVQQADSLKYLETSLCDPRVIQYLTYKYLNLDTLRCMADVYSDGIFFRLIDIAKNVKHLHTELCVIRYDEIVQVLQDLCRIDDKRATLHADISYSIFMSGPIDADLKVDLVNDPTNSSTRSIQFGITYDRMTSIQSLALLDQLGKCNNAEFKLETLKFDTTDYECADFDTKEKIVLNAIDIIGRLPTIIEVHLIIDEIQHAPYESADLPNWDLEKLEIRNTVIDSQVLEQISQCSPHLESISFQDCSMIDEEQAPQNNFDVNMPHSSLQTMCIQSSKSHSYAIHASPSCHDANAESISLPEVYFVHINLSTIDKQFYLVCSAVAKFVVPTLELFESSSSQDICVNAKVTVADLKQLKIHLGPVEFAFNVEKYLILDELRKDIDACALEMKRGTLLNGDPEAVRKCKEYQTRWDSYKSDLKDPNNSLFS